MAVKRIVANVATDRTEAAKAFYGEALGLRIAMDLGWVVTFEADALAAPQISVATEGGAGAAVPDLSIEVDDLADAYRKLTAGGFAIAYGPCDEPWGVKRFFVRDPFGRLVNILQHA